MEFLNDLFSILAKFVGLLVLLIILAIFAVWGVSCWGIFEVTRDLMMTPFPTPIP